MRAPAAGLASELVVGAGAAWTAATPGWGEAAARALGQGLGAAAAFAVADAVARRVDGARGVACGLASGALASPLLLLGGVFEVALLRAGSSADATRATFDALRATPGATWLLVVTATLAVHAPLLAARLRDATVGARALAALACGAAWGVATWAAFAWVGADGEAIAPGAALLAALARGPLFVVGLALGERLDALARRGPARTPRGPTRASLGATLALVLVALALPREAAATAWLRVRAALGSTDARVALAERLLARPAPLTPRSPLDPLVAAGARPPVARDPSRGEALALLDAAARDGDVRAARRLAGLVTPVDPWRALALLRGAAERGDVASMRELARLVTSQRIVPDAALFAEAAAWAARAARAGDAAAAAILERLAAKDRPRTGWLAPQRLSTTRLLAHDLRHTGLARPLLLLCADAGEVPTRQDEALLDGRCRGGLAAGRVASLRPWLSRVAILAGARCLERGGPDDAVRAAQALARADRGGAALLAGRALRDDGRADGELAHVVLALCALERGHERGVVRAWDLLLAERHLALAGGRAGHALGLAPAEPTWRALTRALVDGHAALFSAGAGVFQLESPRSADDALVVDAPDAPEVDRRLCALLRADLRALVER